MRLLILFATTIFLGALLMFWVQPMVGRMLLPLLGGAPAVWNTAMAFYQAILLAGYAYAHFTTRWLGARSQARLHGAMLLLPMIVLPIAIPHGWTPPTMHNPVLWLLALLVVTVGLPLFVVSATSPLLQRWFSVSGCHNADDPYFLYAASNAGSLLGLVSYPVLVEPHLRLGAQSRWWAIGYVTLAVLMAACAMGVWRGSSANVVAPQASAERLTARRSVRWVLLAFAPCSLMLSVTTYITSEVAPIALLWVIPLGIYLLTFILTFARRQLLPHRWIVRALPFAALLLLGLLTKTLATEPQSLMWPITLHCAGLFVVAMFCHGELAGDRPCASNLTEFYLWISVGGVLGGMFNALVAPLMFRTVVEYPATLLLACLLMPQRKSKADNGRGRLLDVGLPLLLCLCTWGLIWLLLRVNVELSGPVLGLVYGLPSIWCLSFASRPIRFALGALAILLATIFGLQPRMHTIFLARDFFGIHRVEVFPWQPGVHFLRHGSTVHGMQDLDPERNRVPLMYFSRSGPLGQIMATIPEELKQRVAVVGLGAGTVACYADARQRWTFFEIDPEVVRIARDPRYFTYLRDCPAEVNVVLGDARLSLGANADGQFGLMILDAYNSDTIPLHLVTREALVLYARKLKPNGVLAFHITNRHFDLEPVFGALARDSGLSALCQTDFVTEEEAERTGKVASRWVVMAHDPLQLHALARDRRWQPPRRQEGVGGWTDDYASLFSVFDWRSGE